MKKILLLTTLFVVFAFTTQKQERLLKVELTLKQWDNEFVKMQNVRNYIDQSNLPHIDVKNITSTIDSFLNLLRGQLLPQVDTVKKK